MLGLVIVAVAWEVASRTGLVDSRFASAPTGVVRAGWEYVTGDDFWGDVQASGKAFLIGFGLAALIGVPAGVLLGWYRRLGYVFEYIVTLCYAAPRVAIVPLLVLWFGIGDRPRIVLVVLMAVLPMLMNTVMGVRTIDPALVRVARSCNASDWKIFRTVVVPGAVPSIVAGAHISLGLALIGVVVGEFSVSSAGVGYRMAEAANFFDADLIYACLLIFAGTGVVISELLRRVEAHFESWRPDHG